MEFSRRRFGLLIGGGAAGLATGATVAVGVSRAMDKEHPAQGGRPAAHTVGFDRHSVLLDGRRIAVWSGEFHPFRLPSPSLWRDILQKFRASGYNTVCIYVSWNYHSPAPGTYDFTGVRDLGAMLDMAAEEGLHVIVRPGPYINAEVDAGGYPGWLTATAGTARTDDPTYLGHVDQWLTAVNAVIAPRQYTSGGGTVLLYQLENEYAAHVHDGTGARYMAHLYAKVRADGIEVPLFHNDKGRNGYWTPGSFATDGESGRYLYAFDGYPSPDDTPPDWGLFGRGGAKGGSTASPGTPGFLAEFGGGWFDCWGGAEFDGQGYAGARATRDAAYERRFYLTNLANGITVHNVYMTFGGTSWGWLPAPAVYTSYDYGAAIDEARNLTSKIPPMKQLGYLLATVPGLARLDRVGRGDTGDPDVVLYHLADHAGSAHILVARNDAATDREVTLPLPTATGTRNVPVRIPARDARLLATELTLGSRLLRWTTAQPMLQQKSGRQDIAVLVSRPKDTVELALACSRRPTVSVLDGAAQTSYDASAGLLRITATLSGLTRLHISGDGHPSPLLLLLADDDASAALWRHDTASGPVLVHGPALLRDVEVRGTAVRLTGDTTAPSGLEVWAPRGIEAVLWNGRPVPVAMSPSGSLTARHQLPGPASFALPKLTGWRRAEENPESEPGYDDSAWAVADRRTSHSPTPVPAGGPVLFADDYGFHYGDVWYRTTFTGPVDSATVELAYRTGTQGLLMAWLDGTPLGAHRMPVPTKEQTGVRRWSATASFPVPAGALHGTGRHVLAVLVRPMAHDEDGGANDAHKTARGLVSAAFAPASGSGPAPALTWRIQGAGPADPLRGPLNTGGLHGERAGWHLPHHDDRHWQPTTLPHTGTRQGVTWYRTDFRLAVPHGTDASLGLTLTDDPAHAYRIQLFLNGWNLGQYINDVGPQHTFVLPNGILDPHGHNTLALAVLSDGTTPAGPGNAELTLLGAAAGGVPLTLVT
ncbi:beta-galactosidase [Peterkaempfera sp. SMS 1(5)a]|uniref:beta-galactosidase n=1 Tax=Peterkaempfera podocarpi TaxID=3232308 RepID=UPI00366DCB21